MPLINKVEPQKKTPKRFNIYIDGAFAFGADEDLVVNYRLIPGKMIAQETIEKLLFESEVEKVIGKMCRLFNIRQRSEKEARDYFKIKNQQARAKGKEEITDLIVNLVIDRLKQKGLINDEEFARNWAQSRRQSKKKGKIALRMELLKKGIDKEIIEDVIAMQVTSESEKDLATEALDKKIKLWPRLPLPEFKKKAFDFLLRRGFEYSLVQEVVENILKKEYYYL